jgi:hypothetical protein
MEYHTQPIAGNGRQACGPEFLAQPTSTTPCRWFAGTYLVTNNRKLAVRRNAMRLSAFHSKMASSNAFILA